MQFNLEEKRAMLSLKGVGATVISRLEQIGFGSLRELQNQDPAKITKQISEMMGSTCWHNSPQARASIQAIIDLANSHQQT
jgi:nucleotidyltransferase/DNA polymerase involved in DNA repair